MEDPKVFELLSLLLDETIANRKDFREGFERLAQGQERHDVLLERQSEMLEQFLRTVAAPQNAKIIELERRLEVLERKVA
jgi:hypothetical protein